MSLIEAFKALPEDDRELLDRKARAERAARLLNDEMFKDALRAVRDEVVRGLTTCPVNDLDGLRQYRLMYSMLDMIVGAIGQHVRTGKIAEDALQRIKPPSKLFGRR